MNEVTFQFDGGAYIIIDEKDSPHLIALLRQFGMPRHVKYTLDGVTIFTGSPEQSLCHFDPKKKAWIG